MQVTVYIPKEMEPGLLGLAEANGQTIQQVLLTPWKAERVLTKSVDERLDRIESKLDQLICGFGDRPVVNYEDKRYVEGWRDPRDTVIDGDGKTQNEVISEHLKNQTEDIPSKIITKGSSIEDIRKLDSKITAHRIETKKGPVRANAAMEGFFSPQPKAKWKGV